MAQHWRPALSAFRNQVAVAATARRFAHDLTIRRTTGKVVLGAGAGGRQSVSGNVATVFGCSGFLGRYVVSKLARHGTQVIVPYRGEYDDIRYLKVTGDLGQIVPMRFDLRHRDSIAECVRHSDIVYNLIGRNYQTKNFSFNDVHVEGARTIAEVCMENNVARLVHVSALNASPDSPSAFLRSKSAGEQAVREVCPDVTIVRPATIYGYEDRFLNYIAGRNRGRIFTYNQSQRIRPVYCLDVALALETMLKAESTMGKIYELYGPEELTYGQVEELVYELLLERKERLRLPKKIAQLVGRVQDMLPWTMMGEEDVIRMYIDDKPSKSGVYTFADLYIEPAKLEDMALQVVRNYRSAVYYERAPPETAEFRQPKPKGRVYHTIW